MSDEAFARRFYSDRAELIALGVPLHSQRDEFTGEELYTLRSENYFLDELELDDDELAALQTALYMLEGTFAYAEPLRLALQNLALGRPGFDDAPTETAASVQVRDPDYSPEMAGRLSKLESAISKQRTIKFSYWSPRRDQTRERTLNPYALRRDRGTWYVVGHDLDNDDVRTFRVSRVRSDIRFATRRERDFRLPAGLRRRRLPRRRGLAARPRPGHREGRGQRRHGLVGAPDAARGGDARGRRLRDRVRGDRAARRLGAAPERPRRPARAGGAARRVRRGAAAGSRPRTRPSRRSWHGRRPPRSSPDGARAAGAGRGARALRRPAGAPRLPARRLRREPRRRARRRRPRRALPHPARGAPGSPLAAQPRQLRRRLLHGLRRARGRHGARRQGAVRRRLPARTAPDAARGARDPARARHRRPVDRGTGAHAARPRPQEARGHVRAVRGSPDAGAAGGAGRGGARRDAVTRDRRAPRRGDRLHEGRRRDPVRAARRAVHVRARAPELDHPHLGSLLRRRALVPARPDAVGAADEGALRAAGRLRSPLPRGRPPGARPLREAGRPLPRRARRDAADRRVGARDAARRHARLADQRDPGRPRRSRRARAGRRPARDRKARRPAPARSSGSRASSFRVSSPAGAT